jgi:hypothetical protein
MSSRSNRRVIAQQTLDILKSGQYTTKNGTTIALGTDIKAALEACRFYNVDDARTLYAERDLRLNCVLYLYQIPSVRRKNNALLNDLIEAL